MRPRMHAAAGVAGLALIGCTMAGAQTTLERRVSATADGTLQFHFASRDGTCGNGRTFFRIDEDGWFRASASVPAYATDGAQMVDACARGPVRVVITRTGGDIVRIETNVGPLVNVPEDGTDLGAFAARDAAGFLLSIAARADGRPAREALVPAALADSTVISEQLLAIARDRSRAMDVRRSAMSWASRRRNEPGGAGATAVARALTEMVRDRDESASIRRHALATIASFSRGAGIPALIAFAADADTWVATQAVRSLARSGDPRARAFTRDAVRRDDLPGDVRSDVIRGLGGDYATSADHRLLRDLYPKLNADRDRDAVIGVLAGAGGRDNTDWLLALAESPTETVARRRRVINALSRLDDPRVTAALREIVK